MNQSEQTPHEGELVPNLKEQFLQQLKQEVSSYNSKLPTGSAGVIRWSGNIGPIKRVCLCRHVCVVCVCVGSGRGVRECVHTCMCACGYVCVCMHVQCMCTTVHHVTGEGSGGTSISHNKLVLVLKSK